MNHFGSPPQNYFSSSNSTEEFERLYRLAESFAKEYQVSLDEVFDHIRSFHSISNQRILLILQSLFKKSQNPLEGRKNHHLKHESWLLVGETGQGKSTLVNSLCGSQAAKEGKGLKSTTSSVDSYFTRDRTLILDTPGFFDTRVAKKNQDISETIVQKVLQNLQDNAHIDAIFFVWCPNFSLRLRLEEILEHLVKSFGHKVLESVVFLINQVASKWYEEHEEALDEFKRELKRYGLTNKVLKVDAKNMRKEDLGQIRNAIENVKPFKEDEFQIYRQQIYYKKFMQYKFEEDEKKKKEEAARKERERIAQETEKKLEAQAKAQEERRRKKLQEIEEKRRKEMKEAQEKQRKEQEKLEKEMRKRRKEEEDRLKRLEKERQEMQRILEEQEEQRVNEAFEHQMEQRLLEEEMTRELREMQERQQKERERIEREMYLGRQGEQERQARLQQELNRSNTNRDGVKVWRGTLGNHYCGRIGLYYCSSCDGECGPHNGCNCPACADLDRKKGIEKYPHRSQRNQHPVNGDGVRVWQGESGNHYCGRRGLYYCGSCDGTCGPMDGCNCPACGDLDRKKGISSWHKEHAFLSTTHRALRLWNAM